MSRHATLNCIGILVLSLVLPVLGGCTTATPSAKNGTTPTGADKKNENGREPIKPPHHDPDR